MLQELSAWIEATAVSKYLFDQPWVWPVCESLHFVGLGVLIAGAGLLDLRLLGMFRGVPIRSIKSFMPWALGGFLINAVTGLLFLVMQPHLYVSSGIWWFKMAFLAVAGLNAMFFETRLSQRALAMGPDDDTPFACKVIWRLSLFSWFAVLYCGRMLPYLGTGN